MCEAFHAYGSAASDAAGHDLASAGLTVEKLSVFQTVHGKPQDKGVGAYLI